MALKKLPNNVQSLLCATSQINSYKRAVEELIYNSLDAESTSIAIRIHIQESTIQVIDNGCGVSEHDFNVLGQRYMTSKFIDIPTIKAAPKTYGYKGEFLSNIIIVSQMVKITSRHESTEETWAKTFHNGKEKRFVKMTTRPSKGTTVDIKGFLYNRSIQKRSIDVIHELQYIKSMLNQLSLAHNYISFSLRDDSTNEIIFKIHKKRDVYQTLSTLFDINQSDVVELQVEKHEYKVKGFIGKTYKDLNLYWIYLNGKFVHDCKLHIILEKYIKKSFHTKEHRILKSKKNSDEAQLFNQYIPFYFVFISCPYIDYNINYTLKESVIEFKNWERINKLLEKLVKLYVGDSKLIEISKPENNLNNEERKIIECNQDTRDQVKKIMDKILGNNSTKTGVSQLQKGVKGKMIKRKTKPMHGKKISTPIPILLHQNNNEKKSSPKNKKEITLKKYISIQRENINIMEKPVISKSYDKKINVCDSEKTKKIPKKQQKSKNMSPRSQKSIRQKHTCIQPKQLKGNCNGNRMSKKTQEIDPVCKKSKIVAQKAEQFLQQNVRVRKKISSQRNNVDILIKNNLCLQKRDYKNHNNVPLPAKINKYIVNRYIINKLKSKPYKTTYDLVQTILKSQQLINAEKNICGQSVGEFSDIDFHKRNGIQLYKPRITKRSLWTNQYITMNSYSNTDGKEQITHYTASGPVSYKAYDYEKDLSNHLEMNKQKKLSWNKDNNSDEYDLISKNMYNQIQDTCTQNKTSGHALSQPYSLLTYDSHLYRTNKRKKVFTKIDTATSYTNNTRHNMRFITKKSKDNFITSNDVRAAVNKIASRTPFINQTNIYDIRVRQTIDESYSIKYLNNKENIFHVAHDDKFETTLDYVHQHNDDIEYTTNYSLNDEVPANEPKPVFGNTYTIQPSNFSIETQNHTKEQYIQSHELCKTYSIHYSNSEINKIIQSKPNTNHENTRNKDCNYVFVSEPQCSQARSLLSSNIEPLKICETIFDEFGSVENEFARSFHAKTLSNDSLYDNSLIKSCIDEYNKNKEPFQIIAKQGNEYVTESVSHHFSSVVKSKQPNMTNDFPNENLKDPTPITRNPNDIRNEDPRIGNLLDQPNPDIGNNANNENNYFYFKNRFRFVPKGMSQIFENCHSKTICDYNLVDDYFEDVIYDNFANNVQVNSEIYEPIIQNVEEFTTKNIHKFQNKVKKDNASLVFDEKSLKEAKVLGQVDSKFIAAIMKQFSSDMEKKTEYLILFDQHAVHERIRLEKNLADYINEDRWTSVSLDNIILKMSKDKILYLHNYKDKFAQLGLNWTILSENEVKVDSIPQAILGKNSREVEKVIKAVRNLIIEVINVIKLQKGCVSLYPKSTMDLVFSEACRYAIKFGDQLTKNDCVELIKALSDCKTPFQCAHGRPVMAVLVDIKHVQREYKINMGKLQKIRNP